MSSALRSEVSPRRRCFSETTISFSEGAGISSTTCAAPRTSSEQLQALLCNLVLITANQKPKVYGITSILLNMGSWNWNTVQKHPTSACLHLWCCQSMKLGMLSRHLQAQRTHLRTYGKTKFLQFLRPFSQFFLATPPHILATSPHILATSPPPYVSGISPDVFFNFSGCICIFSGCAGSRWFFPHYWTNYHWSRIMAILPLEMHLSSPGAI